MIGAFRSSRPLTLLLAATLATGVALPASALDIGTHLIGFGAWCGTALPAILVGARLAGRLIAPDKCVPAGTWLAAFLVWILLASLANGFGMSGLWLVLLPGLLWVGATLAIRDGWPRRQAWYWSVGSFAAFGVYVLLGRLVLTLGERWIVWGWLALIVPVWLTWLRLRTVPLRPANADVRPPA